MVADTENHPILIWNRIPDESGTPADIVLTGGRGDRMLGEASKTSFDWPWGVWTDGERLAITSTRGGWLLIWNTFPAVDDQPADLLLTGGGHMGTPRTITSDGNSLIVGDHNFSGTTESSTSGNFVWKSFPTVDELPYDFFMHDPVSDGSDIVAVGDRLYISGANGNHVLAYRTLPDDPGDGPDFVIGSPDLTTNTLLTNFIISNPVPVTDGQSLFIS